MVLGIFTLVIAVLLHAREHQSCAHPWDDHGAGDCSSLDLDASSGNGDIVSLLQSVKMPVACAGAGCKRSEKSKPSIASEKSESHTPEASPADDLKSRAPDHPREKRSDPMEFKASAAAKHKIKTGAKSGSGSAMPIVVVAAVIILLMFFVFWTFGGNPAGGGVSRSSAEHLTRGGSIGNRSDMPRHSLLPSGKYTPASVAYPSVAQPMQSTGRSPMAPSAASLVSTHSAQPRQIDPVRQSPQSRYVRAAVPLQSTQALSSTYSPLASRKSPLITEIGISGGKYVMPIDDVCALQYEENFYFNVEDAATSAMVVVEQSSGGLKKLELSDFYQMGNSQSFARVTLSESSDRTLDVTMHGVLAASIQDNGSGNFQMLQNGRLVFTVDGDVTQKDTTPWVNFRSSTGHVAAQMVSTMGTIAGHRSETLEFNITQGDPKLLLACLLGIISFFDWPRPAR